MALAHRFLRDVPADGEKVLSQHVAEQLKGQPVRGMLADGSIDLPAMLTAPVEGPRWDSRLEDAEPALRRAWRVNFASLDFRTVTVITLAAMLGLSLVAVAAFPPRPARTPRTDALEFALVTLLIVMFSPLSFNYAYVWLIYPLTVALHGVQTDPARGPWRKVELAWIVAVFSIPSLAVFMPSARPGLRQPLRAGAPDGDRPGAASPRDGTRDARPPTGRSMSRLLAATLPHREARDCIDQSEIALRASPAANY